MNLETTEKVYTGEEHMCPMDGFVCFHNSDLVCGRLGKATLGGGNKSSLFQVNPSLLAAILSTLKAHCMAAPSGVSALSKTNSGRPMLPAQ